MKIIDLTHPLVPPVPTYPGDPPFILEQIKNIKQDGYTAYLLSTALHAGTHIDAPMHLLNTPRFLSSFSPETFIGNGKVLRCANINPIPYLPEYEESITQGDIVLLNTGFEACYGQQTYYQQHPAISPELCAFFIRKKIKLLGMDLPSPDHAPYTLHKELLRADILLIENLANLAQLPYNQPFQVIALPLNIQAEASPARVLAFID
jgi:kynurenine formamidase